MCIYSLEQRRGFIEFACKQSHLLEDELRTQFKEYLGQQIYRTEEELERNDQQLERRRGLACLPNDVVLNRILKYESRTERGLYKSLHELQRLQAGRKGSNPLLPAGVDVTVNVETLSPDETVVAAMDGEACIVGDDPGGQRGAVEIRQLSETPSDSQSTNNHSAEASKSSQASAPQEESMTADDETESRQRSEEEWRRLVTPKLKGMTLKEYLGDADDSPKRSQ